MHLKNLTVLGFKSFADKTSLDFQPGVTAIVGPNGCGKSNVSDAIRWVLGEQSAKALRGGEMADVIFNGTDKRKPLGMAEVSLTINDVDQEHLTAAGVPIDYNEVTVTRRVFRDGGSEYFINKSPCRLKDIQQFFMGTGVGRSSYSIMAQGNITQILSSKPEDRRLIFEEAAGITKFKAQKREALRKLDYTDQNLLRVSDLIREVKRQIGSLQRQAGKARRYKALAMELEHLDTQLSRHQFDVLQAQIGERIQTNDKLRQEIEESSAALIRIEDEIRQLRERLTELEHEISQSQQRGMELKGKAEHHESRIHFNEERLGELQAQQEKAGQEISEAEERAQTTVAELNEVTQRLTESEAALVSQQQQLEQKQEAVRAIEATLMEKQEELRQAQSDGFSATQDLTRARNEINALDLQKQGNIARLEKLSAEKIQLEEERTRLDARLNSFAATVEEKQLNAQTHRGTVAEREERLRQIEGEITKATEELDELLRYQAELRSRLNVLEQLQADHEGYSAGTLAALKQTETVLGSLADHLRVPDQYVAAIEAALGHHLQLVLTQEPSQAQQILAELKEGRASVAPLSFETSTEPSSLAVFPPEGSESTAPAETSEEATLNFPVVSPPPHAPEPNQSVRAIAVVEADPSVQPLLHRLLGLTRIVPDLKTATEAWKQNPGDYHYVTETGEILSRHGVYTGGSVNAADAPGSILGRKNQISDLESDLDGLQGRIAEKSRAKGALLGEQTELEASLQQAATELREHEVAIATQQGEVKALENSQRVLHQKIDTVVYEIQCLANQEEEGREKHQGLTSEVARHEERDNTARDQVNNLTTEVETIREQRETAAIELSETRVELASQQQITAGLRQQKQPLEQRISEMNQVVAQRRQDIANFADRKIQWEAELEESRHTIVELNQQREQVNNHTGELVNQRSAQEQNVGTREEDLRTQRQQLTSFQERRSSIDVELAQKNMSVDNLRERVQQKYQKDIDEIRSEAITITYVDEGPAKVETVSPEELEASGAATDWDEVEAQVGSMQKKLDDMGPVNLVAIEEYEETEQRYQFLSGQHDDLVKAKEQLHEVISRINIQTREMFITTFHKIRDNFRNLFEEIFGGGKADLVLADEGNVLESGIDIVARPPGKKLQSISLLSGGEQTMTAVALLFGIYQVRPSPFCVLDELDAPLDESNIIRFIRVLQRFLSHSQFIIITHNKRTIGIADVLYGVTMQERGISKIVSVKFHKADEAPMDHAPKSLDSRVEDEASDDRAVQRVSPDNPSEEDSAEEKEPDDNPDRTAADESEEIALMK